MRFNAERILRAIGKQSQYKSGPTNEELVSENKELKEEVLALRAERDRLRDQWDEHGELFAGIMERNSSSVADVFSSVERISSLVALCKEELRRVEIGGSRCSWCFKEIGFEDAVERGCYCSEKCFNDSIPF